MCDVVIIDAVRTPMGRSRHGAFRHIRAETLSAHLMQALLQRHPELPAKEIDDVYWGCVQQTQEQGFNLARNSLLLAGLPTSVPGVTVNRLCGSSMQAVHDASRAIRVGDARVCLVGGVEHMGHLPMQQGIDFHPGLYRRMAQGSTLMGITAELLGRQYHISRDEQDAFALRSHQLASRACERGDLAEEIVPLEGHNVEGGLTLISQDEVIRRDARLENLASLKPVFDPQHGTITAGNASALSDGAAALLLMSADAAREYGLQPLARITALSVVGCDPACMGLGPVPAIKKILSQRGVALTDIPLLEINEAFAVQTLACLRALNIGEHWQDRLNLNGGAIALGHPLGCSGARLLTTLCHQMRKRQLPLGLASMCIGLGQGIATLLEQPS